MSEKNINKKDAKYYNRNFLLLLYPDNEEHMKAFELVKRLYDDFAYILHTNEEFIEYQEFEDVPCDEILDNKSPFKEHYHCVLKFPNKRYKSAISKELGLDERFIRTCNLDGSLLYLIHFDDENKKQYPIDDVYGTLKLRLQKLISVRGKDEDEKVIDLINCIETTTTTLSVTSFAKYCASNGVWDVYRRGASIFNQCIKEHNNSLGVLATKQGFENLLVSDMLNALANYYK